MLNKKLTKKMLLVFCIVCTLVALEVSAFAATSWQYQPKPTILSRSSWTTRAPKTVLDNRGAGTYLIFHHTGWKFSSTSQADAAAEIKKIQDYHMDNKNWDDIAYHYIIDPAGRIWTGRADTKMGAHTSGYNNNIGIVNLGDYEGVWGIGANSVTTASYNAMVSLSRYLGYRDSLDLTFVKNHNDFADTACPGRNMEAWIYDSLAGNLSQSMKKN
ncbi:N-acetylmuramoyl-L-alanine amidase [Alkaliphilus hydrothermalis]|uniref:Peptidoglycan recognition protein family domain-containing protein n=1 Tax=Alkaliphilus hydrothermalis TaxID=1482730 RepID=A0ABS2NTK7_9FIRM|nr:N-acetylmuramoyl-L-alanine amidase [Alkaliphilus hydrothermalis]MBM7616273.1 hypothetical protein [Alkaliphilus hydrothermalis]